jgi:hypothetical protein
MFMPGELRGAMPKYMILAGEAQARLAQAEGIQRCTAPPRAGATKGPKKAAPEVAKHYLQDWSQRQRS